MDGEGAKLGRRKVKTSWCLVVVRVTGTMVMGAVAVGMDVVAGEVAVGSGLPSCVTELGGSGRFESSDRLLASPLSSPGYSAVGKSLNPYRIHRSNTRGSHDLKNLLFRKPAAAPVRDGQ